MKGPNGYQKREAARLARLKRADKAYAQYLMQFGLELGEHGTVIVKAAHEKPGPRSPELCFWCGGKLKPVDQNAYRERIANLWQHVSSD